MFVKKIKIKKYGKLHDFNVDFKNGINVIYGENEAGKSTLQSFIKNSLYGMDNKRSKNIKENDRSKSIPLGDNSASGEIYINYNNHDFIINRIFGSTKKDDECSVIDGITGEDKKITAVSPGEQFLNISKSSFINTLFISQLGSTVIKGKDDEIMTKVTSLFQAGGEEVSYDKSIQKLNDMKKEISTSRKAGKLDLLKVRLSNLLEEKHERINLSNENMDEELKHIDLKEHRDFLAREINRLEICKKYLKKSKLQKEYKDIMVYLQKSNNLKRDKENVEKQLMSSEGEITLSFIEEIKDEIDNIINIKNLIDDKRRQHEIIVKNIEEKKNLIDNLNVFEQLPDGIEQKIIKLELEIQQLENKVDTIKELKREILSIDNQILRINSSTDENKYLSERKKEIEEMLKEYETDLRTLESLLINNSTYKTDKEKLNNYHLFSLVTLSVSVIFILLSIFFFAREMKINIKVIMFFLVSAVSAVVHLHFRKQYSIMQKSNMEYENYQKIVEDKKQNIDILEKNIDGICNKLKLKDYGELILKLKNFDRIQVDIDILTEKKNDKKRFLSNLDEINTLQKLHESNKIVNTILNSTNTKSIEEFIEEYRKTKNILSDIDAMETKLHIVNEEMNNEADIYNKKWDLLKQKLTSIKIYSDDFDEITEELEDIKKKIDLKQQIELSLKNTDETYKVLLHDRNISEIEKEVKDIIDNDVEFSYESEDQIEVELREKNKELIETEKSLKDVENNIKNIFLCNRDLNVIEEDIINVKKKIEDEENKLKAIETASSVITESFKEMQRNFGPVINKSVEKYMNALTEGKYKNVKVSEKYSLTLRSNNDSLMSAEYLSGGTWDQVYFSLRLSFIDLLFGDKNVPIFLDEAFIQYDDYRMEKALDLLYSMKEKRQVIIFTCQKREVEYLKGFEDVNIINL